MFFLVLLAHRTITRHKNTMKEKKKTEKKLEVATPRFEPAPQLPPAQKVKAHATWVHRGHKGHRGRKGKQETQGTQGDTERHNRHREHKETHGT